MAKKVLILSGSPQKKGNTALLIEWFLKGLAGSGAEIEIVHTAFLTYKTSGCSSCRACQRISTYECVVDDDAKPVLAKMAVADVIVFATPLYFFAASAQIKLIMDRMFCLYKWDNQAGTMQTVLKGKTLVLLASAFEGIGLDALEKPFLLTAEYTGMQFYSLLVPHAGVSGELKDKLAIRDKAINLGNMVALPER